MIILKQVAKFKWTEVQTLRIVFLTGIGSNPLLSFKNYESIKATFHGCNIQNSSYK